MVRMVQTPRYPVGTKVLKYFNGYVDPFIGTVDSVSRHSGFYHIVYDDGDSEEMTEDDVEKHFHATPRGKKRALKLSLISPDNSKYTNTNGTKGRKEEQEEEEIPMDEVNKFVGQTICTSQTDEKGNESILSGTVLSYFPATKMYRILYVDGQLNDLSYQEVVDAIPLNSPLVKRSTKKRKSIDSNGQSADEIHQAPSASPKRPKAYNSNQKKSESSSSLQTTSEPYVLNQDSAYNIVRQTLFIITNNIAVTCEKKDIQIKVLQKESYKPKDALEKFIEYDGLKSLDQLLSLWILSKDTEPGVLLILKVLAVIPGVTSTALLESQIGKKLRLIDKCKIEGMTDPDSAMSVMARWVIKKWKADLDVNPSTKSKDVAKSDKNVKKALTVATGTASESTTTNTEPKQKPIGDPKRNTASNYAVKPKSNSAHHLRDLMSGSRRGGLSAITSGIGSSRPLATAHHRRSTVLLDAITNRKAKNEEAAAEKIKAMEKAAAQLAIESLMTKTKFGDVTKIEFDKDQEVSKLLGHSRSVTYTYDPLRKSLKSILKINSIRYTAPIENVEDIAKLAKSFSKEGSSTSFLKLSSINGRTVESDGSGDMIDASAIVEDDSPVPPPAPPSPPRPREAATDDMADASVIVEDESPVPPPAPPSPPRPREAATDDMADTNAIVQDDSSVFHLAPTSPPRPRVATTADTTDASAVVEDGSSVREAPMDDMEGPIEIVLENSLSSTSEIESMEVMKPNVDSSRPPVLLSTSRPRVATTADTTDASAVVEDGSSVREAPTDDMEGPIEIVLENSPSPTSEVESMEVAKPNVDNEIHCEGIESQRVSPEKQTIKNLQDIPDVQDVGNISSGSEDSIVSSTTSPSLDHSQCLVDETVLLPTLTTSMLPSTPAALFTASTAFTDTQSSEEEGQITESVVNHTISNL